MNLNTAIAWTAYDLRAAAWDLVINRLAASSWIPRVARYVIYRAAGMDIRSPALSPGMYLETSSFRIGERSFVNRGVRFFNGHASVTIGRHVQVAMLVTFLTDTHSIGGPEERCSHDVVALPIRVGDGTWIGANATVLPGVTISPGCIVAAGAVVVQDCEPNGLYAGVPARRIKDLPTTAVNVDRGTGGSGPTS